MSMNAPLSTPDFSFEKSVQDRQQRQDVALAHRLIAHLRLDDLTYTHTTARSVTDPNSYWIGRLGILFNEAKPEDILRINPEGKVVEGDGIYNITGHYLHYSMYNKFPEIGAIIHTHTPATIAVSALTDGLEPLSQYSFLFYERVGYIDYDALALDMTMADSLCAKIPGNCALFMRNHGIMAWGKTLHEALFYAYFLEKACDVQLRIQATHKPVVLPEPDICRRARDQMVAFETDLGKRDWTALTRQLI